MENNSTNRTPSEHQEYSYIDELLRRLALPAIIVGALIIILFGLIIHFQATPASSGAAPSQTIESQVTAHPTQKAPQSTTTPEPTEKPLTIVVDAGHGGADPGSPSYSQKNEQSGIYEDAINLSIAKKLEAALIEKGYEVIMTRPDEKDLADPGIDPTNLGALKNSDLKNRVQFIKDANADILISIHQNAVDDPAPYKPEVIYDDSAPTEGIALARSIMDALTAEFQIDKPRSILSQDLAVTSVLPCSVLVECGFISNPDEEKNLCDPAYQDRLVKAIITGLEDYLSSK